MKKLSAILATALISVALIGCGGKYKDGTYTGTGKGAASEIKVEVQVKGGEINDIKLVDQHETPTLVQGVEENMIPDIIKKQGTEGVEVISGASNSSKGVLEAVNKALDQAKK
ncbi:FMN-binding protein [Clostridium fallax]|uniref:FMN-binding domain-containing protein n=1 Tax=Clostridium fallax TaxID=1533 RepID=A0A1M4W4Y2_9CLOT|nr:FMN-binding protein [Clostridium fallax]SHE76012.1 FMN-binding domain-containing protein [Clostridium fallax]SQB22871.1 4Fe-4S binding domain/FMN-binding domain-containing protein [Clostridium fallax]